MDASFVQAVQESFQGPAEAGGRVFLPHGWTEQIPHMASVSPLTVHTLGALIAYLTPEGETTADNMAKADHLVHVVDEATVAVYEKIEPYTPTGATDVLAFRRQVWLRASAALYAYPHRFNAFLDAEAFIIWLRSGFAETPDLLNLLQFVVSIRESSVTETVDSTVAQEVKTARGVSLVDRASVPPFFELKPWRTFPEIDQPIIRVSLRLRGGGDKDPRPYCALFEADGNAWKLAAIRSIHDALREKLAGYVILA